MLGDLGFEESGFRGLGLIDLGFRAYLGISGLYRGEGLW